MNFGAERKGLDFLRKESAYSILWSQWRRVSNCDFDIYFGENLLRMSAMAALKGCLKIPKAELQRLKAALILRV
jgi:hypothetical protein